MTATLLAGKTRRAVADELNKAISDAGGHGINAAFAWLSVEVTCACTCRCHEPGDRCYRRIIVGATPEDTDCENGCRSPLHECVQRPRP